MPKGNYAVTQKKAELRSKALATNSAELPQLELSRLRLESLMGQLKDLTAQQASLTASKQEVCRRLAEVVNEVQKLMTFLDFGVKEHYGNRAEKLVEFGLQPFRSQPRVRLVGPDGQPLKPRPVKPAPPASVTLE
jgi:hypothetical protein